MKKFALLPISLFAALAITACGDDKSSSPVGPEGGSQPALSSEALPGSSESVPGSSTIEPTSSETLPPSSAVEPGSSASVPPVSSAVDTTPVEFTTDAVAVPDMGCTTEPLTVASGVKVTCDGKFAGNVQDDEDPTPFDPNAAAYTSFVGIQKIYESLEATDKVVFLLRHAHRTASTDSTGVLTGKGYVQADRVGQHIAGTEEIKYWHSEIARTLQTCMAIAQGRGQTEITHTALKDLNGGWFEKDHAKIEEFYANEPTSYDVVSRWAYNDYLDPATTYNEGYYDLMERGAQFMNDIVIAKIAPQSRISIVVSHDQMLYPLTIFATNRALEMKHHEDKSWLNFLAGVAVIIKADGTVKYVPVKGLDEGTMSS